MEVEDLPIYYILSRETPIDHADAILRVLGFHPVNCTIITHKEDTELAFKICPSVIRRYTSEEAEATAIDIARQTGLPALIIGDAPVLDAVYANGKRESLATNA